MSSANHGGLTTNVSARCPHVTRRKGPIYHGAYLRNDERALQLRADDVRHLMRVAFDEMPWLRREHLPTLRKWAELEVIRKAALRDGVRNCVALNANSIETPRRRVPARRLCAIRLVRAWRPATIRATCASPPEGGRNLRVKRSFSQFNCLIVALASRPAPRSASV